MKYIHSPGNQGLYAILSLISILGLFLMGWEGLSSLEAATPPSLQQISKESPQDSLHKENRKLSVWVTYNDEQFRVYRKIVREFEKLKNCQIEVSRIPWGGQSEKLMYACNSKKAPDIARLDIGLIPKFASGKALLPISDLFSEQTEALKKDLLKGALGSCEVSLADGKKKLYALPDEFTTLALFYNKDRFLQAGLDPENPPQDWDTFVDYAKKLTRDTNGDGQNDEFGFAMEITPWWSLPFTYSFGGNILDDTDLSCLLEKPEAVSALEFQISLTKRGIEAGAWRAGATKPDAGFKNGRYAMIFSGPWNLANFRQSNINYGIALIPGNPKLGIRSTTNVGGNANVIFKTCKNPDLAFEFLQWLLSARIQKIFYEELRSIPLNNRLVAEGYKIDSEEMKVFVNQAQYALPRPTIPGYDRMETIIMDEVETAFKGDRTPLDAYKKACERARFEVLDELERYRNNQR